MDLRSLPTGLSAEGRCTERRTRIESETGTDLSRLETEEVRIGMADEKNCEQMFGTVPLPVGYAGPLTVTFSSGERAAIHLPLATTEAALVASVNRGCKAISASEDGVQIKSVHHGVSRSLVLKPRNQKGRPYTMHIEEKAGDWKKIGEATSNHLNIVKHEIDEADGFVFLTIYGDTDEAMGMNMITIAAQAIGDWLAQELDAELITIAGNVDSDKKPSKRTHDRGRGYEVTASAMIPSSVITDILKTTPEAMLAVADAKLKTGSALAGAIGANMHAANIIAALYLATGQDAAHVVEGSLTDTTVTKEKDSIRVTVRLPAILVGVRGGGTGLPAQSQCLDLLLKPQTKLHRKQQLAESVGAAVLAGELSLLAAQASQTLASAHKKLAR
jgi:hydroxymethylglutaryl-CoA reductase (NADPH)